MDALGQNALASLTGNLPKAVLCIRKMSVSGSGQGGIKKTAQMASDLQARLLKSTEDALNGLAGNLTEASQTFQSLRSTAMIRSGYLALEVQYNPSSIYLDTQAGRQVQYSGGSLGSNSTNQIVQVTQPVATTMSFQLVFDDMNLRDAFMMENTALTAGNAISAVAKAVNDKKGGYSVQNQMDGLMALLTRDETRQVIFFWGKMCFRGELTGVSSKYTMFNKDGNPIRGTVDLTLRQGNEPQFQYDETYWDEAFTNAFGDQDENVTSGIKSKVDKVLNNNFLNINL